MRWRTLTRQSATIHCFCAVGCTKRTGLPRSAMPHGPDDASALAFAGFVIGMDKHDRAAAFAAFEAALAVSPSSALTYILGSVILAWAGEAERAIEWAERGLRLSPFDPYRASAFISSSLGH